MGRQFHLLIFLMLLIPSWVSAQVEYTEEASFLDRIYTGGNVGFSFSNNITSIAVSPIVGYMVTDRFSVGLGGTYQVNQFRNLGLNLNNYGARAFLRYNVTPEFFVYTEYEHLVFEFPVLGSSEVDTDSFNGFFVGGGYAVPISDRLSFVAIALYNLAYNNTNFPYPSPLVTRGGIVASF
ncbi:MAG: hypothetical protein AAFO69_15880 [Bacteroidota bacterium]